MSFGRTFHKLAKLPVFKIGKNKRYRFNLDIFIVSLNDYFPLFRSSRHKMTTFMRTSREVYKREGIPGLVVGLYFLCSYIIRKSKDSFAKSHILFLKSVLHIFVHIITGVYNINIQVLKRRRRSIVN